jgi:hypothetical protein
MQHVGGCAPQASRLVAVQQESTTACGGTWVPTYPPFIPAQVFQPITSDLSTLTSGYFTSSHERQACSISRYLIFTFSSLS